jgi:biotin operon repressor
LAVKGEGVEIASEKHYRLVRPDELTKDEITAYRARLP